jgi:hypothetical protein
VVRPENIAIERHITAEELLKRIKSLEKDVKVLRVIRSLPGTHGSLG